MGTGGSALFTIQPGQHSPSSRRQAGRGGGESPLLMAQVLCEALQRVEFAELLSADLVTALVHPHGPELARAQRIALVKRWAAEFGESSLVLTGLVAELTPA